MVEIKDEINSKNAFKGMFLILLVLSMVIYLTYDMIMTNIFSNYYCNQEPNPKTYISKTVQYPESIYWEDNVYPGFSKEDRELMIINYLDGKHLKTIALNGADGKIYVYSATENDYERIIQNSTEQKDIYKKYQEYAKFIMQNEKIYTKETMPKTNYTVTSDEVKLPFFPSKFLYSDETRVIENSTNDVVGFNRRYMRFFYKLFPDVALGNRYYAELICGGKEFVPYWVFGYLEKVEGSKIKLTNRVVNTGIHAIDINQKLYKKYIKGEK